MEKTFHLLTMFNSNLSVFDITFAVLICTLIVWYLQYYWKRREMYQMVAKMNGPPSLPFIGSALYLIGSNMGILQNMLKLSTTYESPARLWLGPRLFCVIWSPEDLEAVLSSPDALSKGDSYKHLIVGIGDGIGTATVPKWKRHRKIIAPTFNLQNLNQFVEVFSQQAQILAKNMEAELHKGYFDIYYNYVSRCTLDLVCETVLGVENQVQGTQLQYFKWMNAFLKIIGTRMFNPLYHYDFIFNRTSMASKYYDVTNKIRTFTGNVVKEKISEFKDEQRRKREAPEALVENEPKRKSFLRQLIELSESGANLSVEDLRSEVATFMLAGSETSASAISFFCVIMGIHPDIQDKVYEEIVDVLGYDRPVESSDLKKLQYTERALKEVLRIFPIGPMVIRCSSNDIKLKNGTIPADSTIVLNIIGLHRDPNVWPDPLKFDPDRFLPEEAAKRQPYSWLPFLGGPRNCIGMSFAMMSMKTIVATLIRKYRFSTSYPKIEDIKIQTDLALKTVDGLNVSIELRN